MEVVGIVVVVGTVNGLVNHRPIEFYPGLDSLFPLSPGKVYEGSDCEQTVVGFYSNG